MVKKIRKEIEDFVAWILEIWSKIPDNIQIIVYVALSVILSQFLVYLTNFNARNELLQRLIEFALIPIFNIVIYNLKQKTQSYIDKRGENVEFVYKKKALNKVFKSNKNENKKIERFKKEK